MTTTSSGTGKLNISKEYRKNTMKFKLRIQYYSNSNDSQHESKNLNSKKKTESEADRKMSLPMTLTNFFSKYLILRGPVHEKNADAVYRRRLLKKNS